MRADYSDHAVRDRIYALLDTSFHGLSQRIEIAAAAGAHWPEWSVPFVEWEADVAVAHAGVLAIPMVVAGARRIVAGVHAVCTRPEWRRRGCARRVLEEALAYVDDHYDAAVLTTSIPALYEQFGFRSVNEHTFSARPRTRSSGAGAVRRLVLGNTEDTRLLDRVLRTRAPVSDILAGIDSGWLFLTNEVLASRGFGRLYYAPNLDAVIALERVGRTLRLLDIAAPIVPSLEDVLGVVGLTDDTVELCFTPDRVGGGPYRTRPQDASDQLMVRGDFHLPAAALALSPLARC